MNIKTISNKLLALRIAAYQDVQKTHRPDSDEWQDASNKLQPMFTEAANRQKRGEIVETS